MKAATEGLTAVDKALGLLDLFLLEGVEALGLTAAAQAAGLDKATCYRGLQALWRAGLLRRDGDKYRLGFKLLELAERLRGGLPPSRVARPIMERLRDATGQSVQLVVRDGAIGVYAEVVEGLTAIRLYIRPGRQAPLYAGASTRLHLAFLPPDMRRSIVEGPLEQFTPRTVTLPSLLEDLGEAIRATWFALSLGELEPFTGELAAPVFGRDGEVVAALSVAGVDQAFLDAGQMKIFVGRLDAAAKELSEKCGYEGDWASDPAAFLRTVALTRVTG